MREKIGFNTFQLKMIALAFMLIDHVGSFIEGTPLWLRYIGRCSAPLFVFCMCWGLDYTKNRKKYLLRLYLASVAMALLWCFFILWFKGAGSSVYWEQRNNIFSTLFTTAAVITIFSSDQRKKIYSALIIFFWQAAAYGILFLADRLLPPDLLSDSFMDILLPPLTGCAVDCEGGIRWCVFGCLLYCVKNSRKMLAVGYTVWCVVFEFIFYSFAIGPRIMYFLGWHLGYDNMLFLICDQLYLIVEGEPFQFTPMTLHGLYFGNCQWMMLGALPFMLAYNHQKGRSVKWLFYIVYPLHILILASYVALHY